MKKHLFGAVLASIALVLPATAQPLTREQLGYRVGVTQVVDGDTLTLDARSWSPFPNLSWKVRVRGIDTPEKRSQCVAEREAAVRATRYTKTLIERAGNQVYIQEPRHDKYGGRFLGVIILPNGVSLADTLIRSGYARPYNGGQRRPWCVFGQYRP
jgi:endonuclease YncB( thermonuclease family)